MSLFNIMDLWSTRCGEDENFGVDSLICTNLDESGDFKIIIGSLNGFLRIYEPHCTDLHQTSFKPSDLLLETQLPHPIIQIATGQLISGSRTQHIAIAHPKSITVYSFTSIPGSTEHGNQFDLKIMYEHALQHTSYQLVVGPFGGVKGRDFLCSYALDGTLTFFEQEIFVHETQLPGFLLPTPMIYVPESDSFVTMSADWCVESYRYQDLVNTARKKIVPSWSYNLGDSVTSIQTVKQNETYIVVLSERNISCFNAKGILKFTKRLQYSTLCFHIYINDVTNELMILTVSDSGVLFVYECTTLRWSVKLPVVPITLCRANIALKGTLILLSEQGDLSCCYLGTTPSLFVAPPLENSITSYKNVAHKLEKLQDQIKAFTSDNVKSLTLSITEQEIQVTSKILPYDKSLNYCQLVIDLVPSRPLTNVHISFEADVLFMIKPESYNLPTLCEKSIVNASIEISDHSELIPTTLEVTTVVSYIGNTIPRIIRKRCSISPRFILSPCAVKEENSTKIILSTNKPPLPLTVVFQEYRGNKWSECGNNDEIAGFCLTYNAEKKCSVSWSKLKHGYEFSTNSIPLAYLILKHVMSRCKSHKSGSENDEKFEFDCKNIPKKELMKAVERHVDTRNKIRALQSFLEKLSAQYRLIQRRFLITLKEKTSVPMIPLQTLYSDIYTKLLDTIRSIEEQHKELILHSNELQAVIDLTLDLIVINNSIQSSNVDELRQALAVTTPNLDSQGWEEKTYANVIHLLKTVLSNSSNDQLLVSPTAEKEVTDSTHFWNLLSTAFDRITEGKFSLSQKLDQTRMVTPIVEDDEVEETPSNVRKFHFLKHSKLLSKRQPYNVYDSVIDQLNEIE